MQWVTMMCCVSSSGVQLPQSHVLSVMGCPTIRDVTWKREWEEDTQQEEPEKIGVYQWFGGSVSVCVCASFTGLLFFRVPSPAFDSSYLAAGQRRGEIRCALVRPITSTSISELRQSHHVGLSSGIVDRYKKINYII